MDFIREALTGGRHNRYDDYGGMHQECYGRCDNRGWGRRHNGGDEIARVGLSFVSGILGNLFNRGGCFGNIGRIFGGGNCAGRWDGYHDRGGYYDRGGYNDRYDRGGYYDRYDRYDRDHYGQSRYDYRSNYYDNNRGNGIASFLGGMLMGGMFGRKNHHQNRWNNNHNWNSHHNRNHHQRNWRRR